MNAFFIIPSPLTFKRNGVCTPQIVSFWCKCLHFLFNLADATLYILYNLFGRHCLPFHLLHVAIAVNVLQSFTSGKLLLHSLPYFFSLLLCNFSSWHFTPPRRNPRVLQLWGQESLTSFLLRTSLCLRFFIFSICFSNVCVYFSR